MLPLDKSLRNKLEKTVKDARVIAEKAARAALEQLGVEQASPYAYLTEPQRNLRRQLRAHGRQLGDVRNAKTEEQEIGRLIEEVAYEHWHRMLFARFLAENGLLMYFDGDEDQDGVAVTLAECDELATELGFADGWEVAARMAARMLPRIFRPDSPVFALALPSNDQRDLEKLLDALPGEVFTASDSLGWVYQFWQADNKEKINKSEVKIGARELPAVTQLFTEPYMVSFLLDNALGAWWAGKRLTKEQWRTAETEETEEDLRQILRLPGVPLEYLRFVKDEAGAWTPAAGTFSAWPENLEELKVLDPCCGSGHFLVSAFLMLVPLRMELEGLSAREACDAVLRDNLHGLEIDPRCVELAAFALALTAWRFPDAGGYRPLPALQVACSGLSINAKKEEWMALGGTNDTLRSVLELLHEQFADAPTLGSLINPQAALYKNSLFSMDWAEVSPLLRKAIAWQDDVETIEMGVAASGMVEAANLLAGKYHWITTNVPYLARRRQSVQMKVYCEVLYNKAQNDLSTVFLERCLQFCCNCSGIVSLVLPQNWLFLSTYTKFRTHLLQNYSWNLLGRLGENGFESSAAAGAFTMLLSIGREQASNQLISGIDAATPRKPEEKAKILRNGEMRKLMQAKQLANPDARVTLEENLDMELLERYSTSLQGIASGDNGHFSRCFWEMPSIDSKIWIYQQSTVLKSVMYGGRENVLYWQNGNGELASSYAARIQGLDGWGCGGVAVSQMRQLPVTLYTGDAFDINTAAIVVRKPEHLVALWCYCSSPEYGKNVRQIDQALKVTNATLVKVPFDLDYWTQVAAENYPNGLPKPYSNDPTQWIFHGHPAPSEQPLQVAVARLLGYQWPAEMDEQMELSEEARAWIARSRELNQMADTDGIVCIPAVRGEAPASERLLNLVAKAYPDQDVQAKVSELLSQADHAGGTLEAWLRNKFFAQHCKVFQQRPFIWHIWDGLPDGFAALVNYHKLDRKNLESLTYTYLGDWIQRQKADIAAGVDGADDRLAAAETLKKSLELILQGEAPLDIFVRWKPLEQQPIGWDPDINDGVRLNIRPFMSAPDVGKRGAGALRDKPGIEWKKDRGKDVASAPWYNLGPAFGGSPGDRINDHHLTLAEKQAARNGK